MQGEASQISGNWSRQGWATACARFLGCLAVESGPSIVARYRRLSVWQTFWQAFAVGLGLARKRAMSGLYIRLDSPVVLGTALACCLVHCLTVMHPDALRLC